MTVHILISIFKCS